MGQRPRPLVLTIVDTTGIQDYIFGSNKLQHSIGASYLVHWATNGAVYEALFQITGGASATNVSLEGVIDVGKQLGTGGVTSELVYTGGGNAVILFHDLPLAQQFTRRFTRRLLDAAPGLQVVVVHHEVKNAPTALADEVQAAMKEMVGKKQQRRRSMPLLGLGVTAMCGYTGMPAVAEDDDGRLISAEIQAKNDAVVKAEQRLRVDVVDRLRDAKLWFVPNFDELGTKDEASYMAVVHIDGNGMGKRVEAIANNCGKDDDDYISAMRKFADSVREVSRNALRDTLSLLQYAIRERQGAELREYIGDVVPIRNDHLPFRPIVFGGDDATFVCDGRLGLTLAELYLRAMEQELSDGEKLYARAGVAVIKSHYPFSRAYELAEELAKSAKEFMRERQAESGVSRLSAMDWHFGVNGVVLGLKGLRARDYHCAGAGELNMRPVLVNDGALPESARTWRTWKTFTAVIDELRSPDGEWAQSRNKLKKLREALRNGPEATGQFLQIAAPDKHLYEVPGHPESAKTGWIAGDRSTCFDAVEALDFYVSLAEATAPGGER